MLSYTVFYVKGLGRGSNHEWYDGENGMKMGGDLRLIRMRRCDGQLNLRISIIVRCMGAVLGKVGGRHIWQLESMELSVEILW